MPFELQCGNCQGRLLAEQPGAIVSCPHCGTHLQVPGPAVAASSEPAPNAVTSLVTSSLEVADEPEPAVDSAPPPLVSVDQTMALEEAPSTIVATPGLTPLAELPSQFTPRPSLPEPIAASQVTSVFTPPSSATAATVSPFSAEMSAPTSLNIVPSTPTPTPTVPKSWFTLLMGYASAVTMALLFLLYLLSRARQHSLESLPDIVPQVRAGEVELRIASPSYNVAPGHVLKLGDSERFGSLKVTPLRVTQGPLKFEHVLNNAAQREPSQPVLKLWLKFENVSYYQTFAPLDPLLLFRREYQQSGNSALTNQFLCQRSERKRGGDLRYLYELSTTSEFRLAGQNIDQKLAPGESLETFIPSEERIDDLNGDLIWRVQFRKGYHSSTRHGVTTLIDVPFNRKDVKLET